MAGSSRCRAPPRATRSTAASSTRCSTLPWSAAATSPSCSSRRSPPRAVPAAPAGPRTCEMAPPGGRRVVLATRNPGKVAELRRILAPYDVELVGLDEFPQIDDVAETGATFADNALLKATTVAREAGIVAV